MTTIPSKADFESTTAWLEAVAEANDADFDTIEAVAAQLRPELVRPDDADPRDELRELLQKHADFMTAVEGEARAWIDLHFERDGDVDSFYQYSMMNHNLAQVTDEEVEAMEAIAEEEDLELEAEPEDNYVMASDYEWEGVEGELRLIETVLEEVYDVALEDVERVEEQREGETIPLAEV